MQAAMYYKIQNSIFHTIVTYTFSLSAVVRITGNLSYSLSKAGSAGQEKCLLQQLPKPKRVPASTLDRSAPINLPWQNTTPIRRSGRYTLTSSQYAPLRNQRLLILVSTHIVAHRQLLSRRRLVSLPLRWTTIPMYSS